MKGVKEYELLDVPSSLTPVSFEGLRLKAPVPPSQPRNTPEPKKKDAKWPQAEDMKLLHDQYGEMVQKALQTAREDGITEWCTARMQIGEDRGRLDIRQWQDMFKVMKSFGEQSENAVVELSADLNEFRLEEMYGQIISNPQNERTALSIQLEPPQTFYIPAKSAFILDIFPSASKALASYTLASSRFDIIVLDPPWHNKAVSRLKTKAHLSYNTMHNILTELPPVGNWLAPGGLVAIWCTNNVKMINKVKTVLFKRWGVELIAEWVWLKVTCHGEPVVDLNSSFRKPYEILLIGRKGGGDNVAEIPRKRVLIAVPSYHSQKPCLKGMLAPGIGLTVGIFDGLLPDGHRGCELYARNLVEGWMSVGDECLKFMRNDYWTEIPIDAT